ncbi:MAG: diacylglycerol kinase family lipid kinase [Actinomycetota bacterium]|nr:diacylglycerol kinase family lipid kinase [Actinomycetota bacterium]
MRGLLVFNPYARATEANVRDVIAAALASQIPLDVQQTEHPGHATQIAAAAVRDGVDVIFSHGGDGTLNEVIQPLAGSDVRLGIIPGGTTNVVLRNLGLPNDPIAATGALLERLRSGSTRTIALGRANGRYFAANAGVGFDAAVVRCVDGRPDLERAVGQLAWVWCAVQEFLVGYDRSALPISVELPGEAPRAGFGFCIICNTTPYAYLGARPLRVAPDASFDRGLDLVGVRSLRAATLLRLMVQMATTAGHVHASATRYWRDLPEFSVRSDVALPVQLDGEYVGRWQNVTFTSLPGGLTVIA